MSGIYNPGTGGGGGSGRTALLVDTNFYVDGTLGTDSPANGLTPGAGAWQTLQFARDTIGSVYDLGGAPGLLHTVNLAAAIYQGYFSTNAYYATNPAGIFWYGNDAAPTSVKIIPIDGYGSLEDTIVEAFTSLPAYENVAAYLSGVALDGNSGNDFSLMILVAGIGSGGRPWYNVVNANTFAGSVVITDIASSQGAIFSGAIFVGAVLTFDVTLWNQTQLLAVAEAGFAWCQFSPQGWTATAPFAISTDDGGLFTVFNAARLDVFSSGTWTAPAYTGPMFGAVTFGFILGGDYPPYTYYGSQTNFQTSYAEASGFYLDQSGTFAFFSTWSAEGAKIEGSHSNSSAPGAGSTVTVGDFDNTVIVSTTGVLGTLTVAMMPVPLDQQSVDLFFACTVTAVTFTNGGGTATFSVVPTSITPGYYKALYDFTSNSWFISI